jgi:hypothetical protein
VVCVQNWHAASAKVWSTRTDTMRGDIKLLIKPSEGSVMVINLGRVGDLWRFLFLGHQCEAANISRSRSLSVRAVRWWRPWLSAVIGRSGQTLSCSGELCGVRFTPAADVAVVQIAFGPGRCVARLSEANRPGACLGVIAAGAIC